MQPLLEIDSISKSFGTHLVLNKVSLQIGDGEFFFLLGPSGCGKTTLLRITGGLIAPDSGNISLHGESINHIPAYRRDINTVFQNYALFPHLNVFDNVAFGLRMKKAPKEFIRDKVTKSLQMVELDGYETRHPGNLSGGQQQRVALARALVNEPSVLLMDEPLGALDVKLRRQMQLELKHLQRNLGTTFICVTHDQEEAMTMADRIAVMREGNIEQIGAPEEIYTHPQTRFVANFMGESNFFTGCELRREGDWIIINPAEDGSDGDENKSEKGNRSGAETDSLDFPHVSGIPGADYINESDTDIPGSDGFIIRADATGKFGKLLPGVRPEKIEIVNQPPADQNMNCVPAVIEEIVFAGTMLFYLVRLQNGQLFRVVSQTMSSRNRAEKGDRVFLVWPVEDTFLVND